MHGRAQPAPLASRYLLGAEPASLDEGGAQPIASTQLTGLAGGTATLRRVHASREISPAGSAEVRRPGAAREHVVAAVDDQMAAVDP